MLISFDTTDVFHLYSFANFLLFLFLFFIFSKNKKVEKICRLRVVSMAAVVIRLTVLPMPRRKKVPYRDNRKNCVWFAVIELPVIITTPSPVKDAKVNSSIYFISFESFHKCLKLYKSKIKIKQDSSGGV